MGIYNNSNAFFNHGSSNAAFKIGLLQSEAGHCITHRAASKESCGAGICEDRRDSGEASRFALGSPTPVTSQVCFYANVGITPLSRVV